LFLELAMSVDFNNTAACPKATVYMSWFCKIQ
jgi:hypothetical protein